MVITSQLSIAIFDVQFHRYNDSVCYQRFCCKIEFAIIKKIDMDTSETRITDAFEHFMNHMFCIFVRIASARRF